MKKKMIWVIISVTSLLFVAELLMQVSFYNRMLSFRRKEFDENVERALAQTIEKIEHLEARHILASQVREEERYKTHHCAYKLLSELIVDPDENIEIALDTSITPSDDTLSSPSRTRSSLHRLRQSSVLRPTFAYLGHHIPSLQSTQQDTLSLATLLERPIAERIDKKQMESELNRQLRNHGIDPHTKPYHYRLLGLDERVLLECEDFESAPDDAIFERKIFANDTPSRVGIIQLHFPNPDNNFTESLTFLLPSLLFIVLLIGIYTFTVIMVFRQKKLSDIKNDFIHNLTHEFKTPIASLSLASEMLSDSHVQLSPEQTASKALIIRTEAKRLTMLVERVLQMAMFDRDDISAFKFAETDAFAVIDEVVSNFALKVQSAGGNIIVDYEAEDPIVNADVMHLTNLIYNILDNALKYAHPERPIQLRIHTSNTDKGELLIRISDNGIGIRSEDQKHIFERFYRVSTGNVHNVKGVGIGLAYVWSVVRAHKGTIRVESEWDEGTSFIITLPLLSP